MSQIMSFATARAIFIAFLFFLALRGGIAIGDWMRGIALETAPQLRETREAALSPAKVEGL